MIGFSNQKGRDIRRPVPGCMGRMIHLFDLSSGISGTKLLTDKPPRDGCQIPGDCINTVPKESDPAIFKIKETPVVHLPRCLPPNNMANGTSMKMLMAEELSKEREETCKQPTVIAKLMGLDALPAEQSIQIVKRTKQDRSEYSSDKSKKFAPPYPQHGSGFQERSAFSAKQKDGPHYCVQQCQECIDVCEIPPEVPRIKNVEYSSQFKIKHDCNINDERMALVRQKFMEAKHLATSQNLLQSKEFQDALEVLSSNRDLFLKFLEEPQSMLSQHLRGRPAMNTTATGKRITVLRPTKTSDIMREDQMKHDLIDEPYKKIKNGSRQRSKLNVQETGSSSQPTRIVVLKPSPGKNHRTRKETLCASTRIGVLKEPVPEAVMNNEAKDIREVAKEITRQMRESLSGNRRDEMLLSHILSNVTTEEDFFSMSGKHVREEFRCSSTSQVSPASQFSDAFASPCSFSCRSQCPYLPESSVIREAKRRLSERWVLATSTGVIQEPLDIQRSSSTLGEMLSICESKKNDLQHERLKFTTRKQEDCRLDCHKNLQRSQSVPWSWSGSERVDLNNEAVRLHTGNHIIGNTVDKMKYERLPFKGKVSNLFFSRSSKTSNPENLTCSSYIDRVSHGSQSENSEATIRSDHSPLRCHAECSPTEGPIYNYEELLRKNLYSTSNDSDLEIPPKKESIPLEKLMASEDASDNLEQPSPVSVLEAQFEDHVIRAGSSPRFISTESVACTLSWDDDCIQESIDHSNTAVHESSTEEGYLVFAMSLLSSSSLGDEKSIAAMTRWHSLDSPLDPALLETFLEPKEEAARSRERRSNQRLLFDCVNATILDICKSNLLDFCPWPVSCTRMTSCRGKLAAAASLTEEVLGMVRSSLLSAYVKPLPKNNSHWSDDKSSVTVDTIMRKEISGRGWEEEMTKLEVIAMVVEIQRQVIDQLVVETLYYCFF